MSRNTFTNAGCWAQEVGLKRFHGITVSSVVTHILHLVGFDLLHTNYQIIRVSTCVSDLMWVRDAQMFSEPAVGGGEDLLDRE